MLIAMSDFWEAFFLLLIWIPLVMLWVAALFDVFRRDDLGGGWKALWVVCIILVPWFGSLIYLISRPAGATAAERVAMDQESREFVAKYSPDNRAAQLKVLSDLHDSGKLTDAEFAEEKARIREVEGPPQVPPVTAT